MRCFTCNGGLRNWEEHDDPWTEHCKWFPSCGFAREIKGEAFIERIQQNMNATAAKPVMYLRIKVYIDLMIALNIIIECSFQMLIKT